MKAVLFDADGVIQRQAPYRRSLWVQLLRGKDDEVDPFLQDVFAAERTCYHGQGDFTRSFAALLERWKCSGDVADALRAWTAIEVDDSVVELVKLLRASGCPCYLASNQEPYRARYMSETLAYRALFDGEFYSCDVGYAKPDLAYFKTVLDAIALPPENVVFIDDHAVNVDAARAMGLRASVFTPTQHRHWQPDLRKLLASHSLVLDARG